MRLALPFACRAHALLELGKYDEEGTRQFGANGGPMTTATRRLLEQSLVSVTQST